MRITNRTQRGIFFWCILGLFSLIWYFVDRIYPLIIEREVLLGLPQVNSNIFFLPIFSTIFIQIIIWAIRNKLWNGIFYAIDYYGRIRKIRKHLLRANFDIRNEFDTTIVKLPKIIIQFDNKKRNTGNIYIQNSIKFDKKLEDMRIDSALDGYVCERQYLSQDRNWYIYSFYNTDSMKQLEIKSQKELVDWSNKTSNDYTLRLDERATVPLHHMGLVGQTGSGKSYFIQTLIEQILSKKVKHELFIIDPKRTDVYQMSKYTFGNEQTADKTNAIDLIKQFHKRMNKRQDEMQNYLKSNRNKTFKDAGLPALILLIDEFGALRESWKTLSKKERDEVDSILSDVAFMGRQLGCILWVATQQMNAQTMPTAIREQLVLKIALGDSDEQTYRTLFSSGVDISPVRFSAGQGIFSFPGLASADKPRLISTPYCSFLDSST
ncbi:hypothetical protein ADIAL_0659 [Alkalibacterium sp. AK22]|uniref:FtsK/SpoIIIE domain-containing protein n=1 Tax=Alkalibacterium sp. AK22 TaxID=1229520 RepID=UPI00044C8C49|nr:FtsK/SpoIIIE domain-containing protein [Alkalibacterium sp. AK22]EXJ23867.1 hypothetical protein ADIAL_0659 [Alkalibacterium sp. AK22]